MLQGRLLDEYNALPPRLLELSEFDLVTEADPGPTEYKMRQNFTEAVRVAREKGGKIRVTSVYEEVVSRTTFFNWYMGQPHKVAFIFRPVVTHSQYYQAIFHEGLRKLFKYVQTHDLDPRTMATFAKIVDKAADRVVGPVVQKIAMHQKQEITHTGGQAAIDITPDDPVQIRAKIQELQDRMNKVKTIDLIANPVDESE